MKEFDWTKFKDRSNTIVVHCKTIEEANDFCKQMDTHGLKWCNGQSYLDGTEDDWNQYKKETCYHNHGYYANYNYYKKCNYTILEWSDFMKKEFTKADLKYGYLVELRNGNKAIYMPTTKGDYFDYMSSASCLWVNDYNEDLMCTVKCSKTRDYDVVAVYGYSNTGYKTITKEVDDYRELLWRRKDEVKEMTMEDLEKHFGCKVKIVKETN